jgi:hypothetical protein
MYADNRLLTHFSSVINHHLILTEYLFTALSILHSITDRCS